MADVERQLLSRTINSGAIDELVSRGIASKHFERHQDGSETEHALVFKTMVNHKVTYNTPPSREAVLAIHPNYQMIPAEDALDYYVDKFVAKVKRRETQQGLIDIAQQMAEQGDEIEYEMALFEVAERVSAIVPSARVHRLSDAPDRRDRYLEYLRTGHAPGVPLGFATLDRVILGIQRHELVTIAAYSNAGKSLILQQIAMTSYLMDPTQRPLFISLEMEGEALMRRFDAMATKIRINAIKALEIGADSESMKRWEQWADRAANAPNDILVIDDVYHASVERIMAETTRHKPTATYTDYVQLMEGSGDNSYIKVGNAIKGLKRIARMTGIPQFTAAQTTRGAAKSGVQEDNIADSIEIYRSSDLVIGIDRTDELDQQRKAMLKIVKNRDGARAHCEINFDWETMDFTEYTGFEVRPKNEPAPVIPDDDMSQLSVITPEPNPFLTYSLDHMGEANPFLKLVA